MPTSIKYLSCIFALLLVSLYGQAQVSRSLYQPSQVVGQAVSDYGIHLSISGGTDMFTPGTLLKLRYQSADGRTLDLVAFLCSRSSSVLFLRSIDHTNTKFPLSQSDKVTGVTVLGYNLEEKRRLSLQKLCP